MASSTVRVAAAQFYSGADVAANLATAVEYVRQAGAQGVDLLVLPENSNRVRDYSTREECFAASETLDGAFVTGLQEAAAEHGVMISAGVDLRGAARPDVHIGVILLSKRGEILHVHHKTVLWDYEYTLFVPGSKDLEVVHTDLGAIGIYSCADGIVPEVPRVLSLKGAQILANSLNSRGPDEMRVHEPVRALENHVWMVASNTVGGPPDGYPWTGGSQVISPEGAVLANAGEVAEGMIWADIDPSLSHAEPATSFGRLSEFRRPDLYEELTLPTDAHRAAAMYGPLPSDAEPRPLRVATLQTSWYHSDEWTLNRIATQIGYAASRGARLGVFPENASLRDTHVLDPNRAVDSSRAMLDVVRASCAQHDVWVVASLVEELDSRHFLTAVLVDGNGEVAARYRKCHLDPSEAQWASAGDELMVVDTPLGRIGMMLGNEVWLPEVARILALRGAEVIVHPVSWDRPEAATMAAVERTEENRVHLVSCARTDNPGGKGSQVVVADRFIPGQPIAVMRYPTAYTSRTGFEEDLFIDLDLTDSHSKMQGFHLDPLRTRQPELYGVLTANRTS